MVYPSTVIYQGVLAILSLTSFLYLFYFKKEKDESLRHYYKWFFYFFLYNIILLIPLFSFNNLGKITGTFYTIALAFLGIATWYGFNLALNLRFEESDRKALLSNIYLFLLALIISIHFIFPQIPTASINGRWVFWHTRDISTYLFSALTFVAGWAFTYINFREFFNLPTFLLKSRVLLYAIAGFLLPISGAFYFGAQSIREIQISYILSVAGMVFFAIGNIILGALIKSSRQTL